MSSDPFEVFIAEQGKRETEWLSIRAAKKQKVDDRRTSSKDGQQEELAVNMEELKRRLDEKNTECATLKGQLAELQRASVELLSKNLENVCKMMERLEDALLAMEHNIAVRLDRMEHRLDSYENMSFQFHKADELPTIDSAGSDDSFESIRDGPSGDATFSADSYPQSTISRSRGLRNGSQRRSG